MADDERPKRTVCDAGALIWATDETSALDILLVVPMLVTLAVWFVTEVLFR